MNNDKNLEIRLMQERAEQSRRDMNVRCLSVLAFIGIMWGASELDKYFTQHQPEPKKSSAIGTQVQAGSPWYKQGFEYAAKEIYTK